MTQRVLVTGAAGLLGRHVVRAWVPTAGELVAVGRQHEGRDLDLSRPEDAARLVADVQPDVVLHLAGGPSHDLAELYARNVLTGMNMLEAVVAHAPGARVLLVGSAAEYGAGDDAPLAEQADLEPVTEYGRAKVAQSRLSAAIAARSGVHVTVLRPFNIAAAELPPTTALGNIRRQVLASGVGPRTVVCGRTDVRRDFVVAADVAAVMVELVTRPPGGTVNLCSGQATSLQEVINEIAALLDVDVDVELDPVLAAIPAGGTVVGNPARLVGLGLGLDGSARHVAGAVLGSRACP